MTSLNHPKYKMSVEDMKMIVGGKKVELVTSIEYIPVKCPDGFPSEAECYVTLAHITIYNERNGKNVVVGTRTKDD